MRSLLMKKLISLNFGIYGFGGLVSICVSMQTLHSGYSEHGENSTLDLSLGFFIVTDQCKFVHKYTNANIHST